MRPLKASLFFLYCLAALTAVGTAVSHLWTTSQDLNVESARAAEPAVPVRPAAPPPAVQTAPASQPS